MRGGGLPSIAEASTFFLTIMKTTITTHATQKPKLKELDIMLGGIEFVVAKSHDEPDTPVVHVDFQSWEPCASGGFSLEEKDFENLCRVFNEVKVG